MRSERDRSLHRDPVESGGDARFADEQIADPNEPKAAFDPTATTAVLLTAERVIVEEKNYYSGAAGSTTARSVVALLSGFRDVANPTGLVHRRNLSSRCARLHY
jgi:hypothetical protein